MNEEQVRLRSKYIRYGYKHRSYGYMGNGIWLQDEGYYKQYYRKCSRTWKKQANRKFRHKNEELVGKNCYHKHNGEYVNNY